MTRRWLGVAASFMLGVVVGAAVCEMVAARGNSGMIEAGESKYAHAMFCYAPANDARLALEKHLSMIGHWPDSSDMNRKEVALAQASLSLILDRLGDTAAEKSWQNAEATCRRANYSDCSRQHLKRYAEATCQSR